MEDDRSKTFRAYGEAYYNSKDLAKAIDLAKLVTQKRLALRETQINYLKAHPESAISVKIAQELSDKNSDPFSLERNRRIIYELIPRNAKFGNGPGSPGNDPGQTGIYRRTFHRHGTHGSGRKYKENIGFCETRDYYIN